MRSLQHSRASSTHSAPASSLMVPSTSSSGLTRWAIPYAAITFVGESSLGPVLGKRVAVRIGRDSEILLAPDDPGAFFADVAAHAPHLRRRGASLVAA